MIAGLPRLLPNKGIRARDRPREPIPECGRPMRVMLIGLLLASLCGGAVKFTDATAVAGVKFTHNSGRAGKKWLPETMGSGAAFFDAEGDSWPDILLLNSKDWSPRGRKSFSALYRNNRNGTFTNITTGSGLDIEMYAM